MDVREFFEQMESEYRSSIPWPWPRTMGADDLDLWRSGWPDAELTSGAFINGNAVIRMVSQGEPWTLRIDLNSAKMEEPPIYCGLGCQCVTQCGDFYDFHGYPKPPENKEVVDAARKAAR